MARFGRFEVRREMRDAGTIRPDDAYKQNGGQSSKEQREAIENEANKIGFDDEELQLTDGISEVEKETISIQVDDKGNPVLPAEWTYITHGSSRDRWDTSLLGNDFVVGNGTANGKEVRNRPLCCVERSVAKMDYERSGANAAKAYGGEQQAFEIRVLLYKNPRLGDGRAVREKLDGAQTRELLKYYMYQDGRHPAVPAGTKLTFLKNGGFDDITNTDGNNILWYIPEQYLENYLEDVERMQTKEQEVPENTEEPVNKEMLTNADVMAELSEYYTEDVSVAEIKAYLVEKMGAVYGERLAAAGIDISKFLEGKVESFEGAESYKALTEELDNMLEVAERQTDEVDKPNVEEPSFISNLQSQVVTDEKEYVTELEKMEETAIVKRDSKALESKDEI